MTNINGLFCPLCDAVVFPVLAEQANQWLLTIIPHLPKTPFFASLCCVTSILNWNS